MEEAADEDSPIELDQLMETASSENATADNNNPPVDGDQKKEGWNLVVNKNTAKKVSEARRSLQEFRDRLDRNSNGVFCVILSRREEKSENGVSTFEPAAFSEGILPLCTEIVRMFPFAKPLSKNGRIHVWTNSVEEAKQVIQTSNLLKVPIMTKCHQLEHNWARISRVDRGFTEDDIRSALTGVGVIEVRRETTRRRINTELQTFDTDRVLLKFGGVPPSEVVLAGKQHKVTLHAGSPVSCFKCQRLGHIAANCKNNTACKKCGSSSHVIAECKNNARCVNCRGPHASSSSLCPLRACEIEKRKILMEKRLIQQLKSSHPTAAVETMDFPALVTPAIDNTEAVETESPAEPAPLKSYAAAVRTVVVTQNEKDDIHVNLPNPTAIPKTKKKKKKTVVNKTTGTPRQATSLGTKRKKTGGKTATSPSELLQPLIALLEAVCPKAASGLRELLKNLGPLLTMLGQLPAAIGAGTNL